MSHHDSEASIGEDSFMDTVANLVGILIIFVVLTIARSKPEAMQAAVREFEAKKSALSAPVEKVSNLNQDLEKLDQKIAQYAIETEYRRAERDLIMNQVTAAQFAIEEKAKELDEKSKEDLEATQKLFALESQFENLRQQQDQVDKAKPSTVVLQHLPTPMAKTVFTKELHLMMKEGRVAVIPWDNLLDALKRNVELAVQRNSRKEQIQDRLGPIGGFMMDYRLISKQGLVSNGSAVGMGQMISLDRFELDPTEEVLMETVEAATGVAGRLAMELSTRNPRETVATVWVYPDSFDQFRQLKEHLYKQGIMTAARPLPDGIRIGAAPTGSHSVAQ